MKSLRRSFHTKENTTPQISTPIPAVSKPTTSIQPPKKVIRALQDHRPQAPHELSFQKGDFFHVINEIDQGEGWYEANNPMTGARGLVPKSKFEEFNKSNAAARVTQAARASAAPGVKLQPTSPRQPVFYAIVQHDFVAERPDELDAKAGDHISVVAQSNFEWLVAKPINRLGRPGLIPVSFVAIHDPGTGRAMTEDEVKDLMQRGEVPGVEEWKKSILDYKAATISLGVIDDESSRGPVPNSPYMPQVQQPPMHQPTQELKRPKTPFATLPPGMLISAEVVSWHYEMDEYWFRINALFQPEGPSGSNKYPPAKQLILFRVYTDFYDFQVNLLNTFPVEAGRIPRDGEELNRILPYMPGPAPNVDDKVTNIRREELDAYLVQLCGLWEFNAEPILRHQLIRDFFTPKAGDAEEDVDPAVRILEERYGKSFGASQDVVEQVQQPFARMGLQENGDNRFSGASSYDEDNRSTVKGNNAQRRSDEERRLSNHRRSDSSPAFPDYEANSGGYVRAQSPHSNGLGTQSPALERNISSASRNYSAEAAVSRSMPAQSLSTADSSTLYSGFRRPEDDSPSSFVSNPSYTSSQYLKRTKSNTPSISATNPSTAFVKIKIFDRLSQDLIAIRVSPRVTHNQLMDKVRARLGTEVRHLAYRNSITNNFFGLEDDLSLKEWLGSTDKHVLYAD